MATLPHPSATYWNAALDQCEQLLGQLTQASLQNQFEVLDSATRALQALVVQLPRLSQQTPAGLQERAVRQRIRKLANQLALLRENFMRRQVFAERALATLMPCVDTDATYAPATSRGFRTGYGAVARQSGEFKVTAA